MPWTGMGMASSESRISSNLPQSTELSRDKISLCIPGCPGTHIVDQTSLEVTETLHLGLKAYSPNPALHLL
ncbi:rCG34217 [Rattus norvegicus]|uniref:RCG34217 n=1 Tax=Rattus norvegicus TaxID=10116 RepID=A6HD85_RAT|nr:rCG34217 [Rattus norvegicus]